MAFIDIDVTKNIKAIDCWMQGEKNAEGVHFDISTWIETYGAGTAYIYIRRNGDETAYFRAMEVTDGVAEWLFSAADTAKAGDGRAQAVYITTDESVVKKTNWYHTVTAESEGDPTGEDPDPYKEMATEVIARMEEAEEELTEEALGEISDAKDAALEDIQDTMFNLAPEFVTTASYSAGDIVLYIGNLYEFTADHAAGAWIGTDARQTTIGGVVADLKEDIEYQVNTGAVLTNITPNWIDAYVNRYGVVVASSASQSALIKLKKGERITVGTRNTSIAIISITDKDTLSISDTLTPVYITSTVDQFEEYTYTAENGNVNVVICVAKTDYSIAPYLYGDFRTTIQEYIDKIITYSLDDWIYGSYYSLDVPQFTHALNRNRTELFHVVEGDKITIEPNGLKFVIGVWTFINNVWHIEVNDNTWKTDPWEYDITHDSYWVVVFSKLDNSDIAEGENTAHVECTNINVGEDVFDLKNDVEKLEMTSAKAASIFNEKGHIISHRGEPYPENTLAGFERCISNGVKIIEMDLAFTADNVAVLLHDTTINRTGRNSDGSEIASTINISDITYAQALQYDFGIYKGSEYAGTKIPKLVDVLLYFKWHRCGAVIDLTGHTYTDDQLTILHEIMSDCGMVKQCAINAYNAQLDNYTAMFDDSILNPTGSYVNITTIKDNIKKYENKMAFMIASGVVTSTVDTSKEYIAQITRLGVLSILAFIDNVNDAKTLFNNGCDFLYSNILKDSDLE